MGKSTCKIMINHRDYEIDPDNMQRSITEQWDSLRRGMDLGNAAGYRLISVEVQVEDLFRSSDFSSVYSTLRKPEHTEQKAALVVRHTGLDLAHKEADGKVTESRFTMVVPIGTESFTVGVDRKDTGRLPSHPLTAFTSEELRAELDRREAEMAIA